MKPNKVIQSIVVTYFVIGITIGLTQLGLSKIFEPACNGTVKHSLWEYGPSGTNDGLQGGIGALWQLGVGLASWLPDLYQQLITGDMALRDYLLGGYECIASSSLSVYPTTPWSTLSQSDSMLDLTSPPSGLTERSTGSAASKLLEETLGERKPSLLSSESLQADLNRESSLTNQTLLGNLTLESGLSKESLLPKESLLSKLTQESDVLDESLLAKLSQKNGLSSESVGPTQQSQFISIEPLTGVTLEVPRDWLVVGSEAIQQHATAVEAVYGQSTSLPKAQNTQVFVPPTADEGVGIVVTSMAPIFTQEELRSATQADLQALLNVMESEARRGIESMGHKLLPITDIVKQPIGERLGLDITLQMQTEDGLLIKQRQIYIPTTTRYIVLGLNYGKYAPPVFRPILSHALATLAISD